MAKKQVIIQKFDGGVSDDIRQQSSNSFALSKNFNIFSNPNRLTPVRDSEADELLATDANGMRPYAMQNFLYTGSKLYGYGHISINSDLPKLFSKTSPEQSGAWVAVANAEGTGGARQTECFVYYKDYIYGWTSSTLWRFQVSTSTWTNSYQSIDGATFAQGLVGNDDILYLPYDNKIATLNNTSFTTAALTLPSNLIITAVSEYGKYLAIATRPSDIGSQSKVFLWDKISSDVSEVLDWGEENLYILSSIDAGLIGISVTNSLAFVPKIVIRMYFGGRVSVVKELTDTSITLGSVNFAVPFYKNGNRLFFPVISTNGSGIWSFGRKNENTNYAITQERNFFNNVAVTSISSIYRLGDYTWVSHSDASQANQISKTNDAATYTTSCIYESQKFNGDDINRLKRLIGVAVSTAYLPSAGTVVIKYKIDSDTTFANQIFTNGVDNSVSREGITIESTGKNLPEFYEIQFQITSTGGAEITGLKFVYEEKDTLLNIK